MIKVFTGDDRVKAKQEVVRFLGQEYEVFDGPDLLEDDLLNIFLGSSLLMSQRSVLIRDLSKNKPLFDKLLNYLDTSHKIVVLETKIDKRSAVYKALKEKNLLQDFPLSQNTDYKKAIGIFPTAKRDGRKAIAMLEEIKTQEDPIMFFGLLVSSALKDYDRNQGIKEKRILKLLSQLDLKIKSSSLDPWLIIESFLVQVSHL